MSRFDDDYSLEQVLGLNHPVPPKEINPEKIVALSVDMPDIDPSTSPSDTTRICLDWVLKHDDFDYAAADSIELMIADLAPYVRARALLPVQRTFDQMQEPLRTIAGAKYFLSKRNHEIAADLGYPEQAVDFFVAVIRERLASMIQFDPSL